MPGYGAPVGELETAAPGAGVNELEAAQAPSRAERVSGSFIVALAPGQDPHRVAVSIARDYGGESGAVYDAVINGFQFLGPDDAGRKMASDPRIRGVQPDYVAHTAETTAVTHLHADDAPCVASSTNVCGTPWYTLGATGSGQRIGILDTGADLSHPDIAGNIDPASTDASTGVCNAQHGSAQDLNGHGTRTTSNAVGAIGVAPDAKAVVVKVFPGSGASTSFATIACGVNYLVHLNKDTSTHVVAVNASIAGSGPAGTCTDGGLRQAVCQLVDGTNTFAADHVTPINPGSWTRAAFFAAAGNTGGSAGGIAPARFPETIAVSAFDCSSVDCLNGTPKLASFSSRGAVVALGAPGASIWSAKLHGGHETASGTSRSSPQAAGAAADLASAGVPADQFRSVLQTGGRCPGASAKNSAGNCASGHWPGDGSTDPTEPFLDVQNAIAGAGPTGSFIAPTNGSRVTGSSVSFQVQAATTSGTVQSVQITIPGASNTTLTTSFPGSCSCWQSTSWDTTLFSDGSYVVNALITDSNSRTSSISETVNVDNVDGTPVVTWVSPSENAHVPQTFSAQVSVADDGFPGDTTPPTAVLLLDGVSQGAPTAPNYTWTLHNVSVGPHTLRVDASDGNSTGSSVDRHVDVVAATFNYGPYTFPDETAGGWTVTRSSSTVKWHLADITCGSDATNAESGTGFGVWYGKVDNSCTYRTGSSSSGTLVSPLVTTTQNNYKVEFQADRNVDSCSNGCTRDQTYVEVNFQDGGGWRRVYYADAGHAPSGLYKGAQACTTPSGSGFQTIVCSLSTSARKVQIRFGFNTTTSIDPAPHFGWAIDDVSVHT